MTPIEPSRIVTADDLGVPRQLNAADYFVDRHLREGRGDRVAVICGAERLTYAEVADRVSRIAATLRGQLGVRPGDRVVLVLVDDPAFVCTFFGAMKIGAIPVPVNTLWTGPDYRYVLDDSQARVAIVSPKLLPPIQEIPRAELQHLEHLVAAGDTATDLPVLGQLIEGASGIEPTPTDRDDPALWLYSSGSTGSPKACVHRHRDMVVTSELFGKGILGMTVDDRCFSAAKLFFAYGLGNALTFPFAVGGTSILLPDRPTAAVVYETIERHRPTQFFWVPTGFGMLLAHRRDGETDFDLSSIRHAVSAGEALPPALFTRFKDRFGIELLDGLGSTEALHTFISNRPGRVRPGSSGEVVPGYEVRLIDTEGDVVGPGEVGQLAVRGDSICAEYWNQPAKTAQILADGWLRTGDRYRQDEGGYFWHEGRVDDLLKVGGMWVSPVEVEHVLSAHPSVRECAVVGRRDHDRLVKPAAFVVVHPDVDRTPALADELHQFALDRLARYKRPRWVEFVPALPRTATGKLQRFKLRS